MFEVKIQKGKIKRVALIDALEKMILQPKRPSDKPFQYPYVM